MASGFDIFLERLAQYGLEWFKNFPGVYRASVKRVDDPEHRGRIQVCCPAVGHAKGSTVNVWVDPSFPAAGKLHGDFFPPSVGDSVWVSFENGNPGRPNVYWGGWYGTDEVPAELGYHGGSLPTVRGFKTPGGHVLAFSDEPGDESILISWKEGGATIKISPDKTIEVQNGAASLKLNADGSVEAKDAASSTATLDGKGNVVVKAIRIALGGASALIPLVKFNEFMLWAATHTHISPVGPTSPAIPPPLPNIATTKVFVDG